MGKHAATRSMIAASRRAIMKTGLHCVADTYVEDDADQWAKGRRRKHSSRTKSATSKERLHAAD